MTKEELAAMLDGCEYGRELGRFDSRAAKASGLVVVYGSSDEVGAFNGATALVDRDGVINRDQIDDDDDDAIAEFVRRKKTAHKIEAIWCDDGPAWTYRTEIPHVTFDVFDDGNLYCRGIVFSISDLGGCP